MPQLVSRRQHLTLSVKTLILIVHSSALINTNRRISDLQFSNIMASLSHVPIWEPMKVYQYYNSVRRRMSHKRPVHTLPNTFWRSSKLRHWSSTPESALSVIAGNFQARFLIRNLCVDIIEQLHRAAIPVILAMKVQEDSLSTYISHTDLLKYLIRQALQIRDKVHTEKSMSLTCAKFHDSTDEAGWFQLFEATLADIGSLVYIIVDLVILDKSFSFIDNFSWIGAFEQFFETLINRKISTKVKVLLVCYGSLPIELSARDRNKFVIPAKADSITARQRKFARAVKSLTIRNKSDSST
jgi:hypothetical protein